MIFSFKSIRANLLASFVIFLLLTSGFIIATDYWFEALESNIQKITNLLDQTNQHWQSGKRLEFIFFNDEVINEQFYESGTSKVLSQREEKVNQIKNNLSKLEKIKSIQSNDINKDLEIFQKQFAVYENTFKDLMKLYKDRGFKGYGVEGKMRDYVHNLEKSPINLVKLLTIRRHEKDFILRKQKEYLKKWHNEVKSLRADLSNQPASLQLLNQYADSFERLAHLEEKIGFNDNEGLKKNLNISAQIIDEKIKLLNEKIFSHILNLKAQNAWVRLGVSVLGLVLFVLLALYLTRLLSKPITQLSESIHTIVKSNFSVYPHISFKNRQDELGVLSRDVGYLVEKVKSSLTEIKDKSDKITQKQEILMNGVNYAKRIQQAILPDLDLEYNFKNHFIVFRPQFDVSGDFYWFTQLENRNYVAVIDCTGKGMAGAFMSLIGYSLLNKVVKENKFNDLSLILETLNLELRIALGQDKQRSDDSMEIALCCIEHISEKDNYFKVSFAGAMRSLIYSQGWEINEIKGNNRPIGGTLQRESHFDTHSFELKKGNVLYLCTNGYINQQDSTHKPFGNQRFKELLSKIIHLPMNEQAHKLNQSIDEFLENTPPKDDITILGLKL
jgi:serine phosphatase RsbU (regulator of sigma subunit)